MMLEQSSLLRCFPLDLNTCCAGRHEGIARTVSWGSLLLEMKLDKCLTDRGKDATAEKSPFSPLAVFLKP